MQKNRKNKGILAISLSLVVGIFGLPAQGATLKQGIFLIGEIAENSVVFSQDTLNFEELITSAFSPIQSDALQLSLINLETETQSSPKFSLTFDSVVNSISQLRFDAPDLTEIAKIEVLPQTSPELIMRGIYEFKLPDIAKQPNDIFTFDNKPLAGTIPTYSLPTASVLNAPGSGLNVPFYGAMGGGGLSLPVYGGAQLFSEIGSSNGVSPVSVVSNPVQRDSIRSQFVKLWTDNVDARWDLYPDEIEAELPEETKGLSTQVSKMDQMFDLKVDVSLPTMPQDVFLTPLDLKDDYVMTSPMLDRSYAKARLAVTENVRNILQENAQKRQKDLVDSQRRLQDRLYQRNKSLREQQP